METKPQSKTNATDERTENLTCWRTVTSPQCLRVETTSEVHLFPYGYFQHAKFIRQDGKDEVEIQFQDRIVSVKGKGLEPLCDALERLAAERIRMRPKKYEGLGRSKEIIEEIEVKRLTNDDQNSRAAQTGNERFAE